MTDNTGEQASSLESWLETIGSIHPVGWDLGLERVAEVGRRLEVLHPSDTVILVAGTNGKGSTCEYLEKFALANDLRVGKSTSPHLFRFNERIAVDGHPVSDNEIVAAFQRIDRVRAEITLTYFEFATLASLLIFRDQKLDVAVLEIGLGGRLDAMNIVEPDLTIITSIALDHQDYLGSTRDDIAREKAGIMRPSVPCLIADRHPPDALQQCGRLTGASMRWIGTDFDVVPEMSPRLPEDSFAVAMEAAARLGWQTRDAGRIASETVLAGRRTFVPRDGARTPRDVLLDVAHNPAAANSLAGHIATLDGYAQIHAVLGMYEDKDIESVSAILSPLIKTWHLSSTYEPRAASPELLKARLSLDQSGNVWTYDKIEQALAGAVSEAGEGDLILVFGSFPVVGTCLQLLMIDQ